MLFEKRSDGRAGELFPRSFKKRNKKGGLK
jgi:hypothetical protein